MKKQSGRLLAAMGCLIVSLVVGRCELALAGEPVVYAVIFYSPTCPHCHQVLEKDLQPLSEHYGAQLHIVGIDVTHPNGQALFRAAIERFGIPDDRQAVPTLIVGDIVLVGSLEIPGRFPGLVDRYLKQGGVDWPDIPGLIDALSAAQPEPATVESTVSAPTRAAATPGTRGTAIAAAPTATPTPTALPGLAADPMSTNMGDIQVIVRLARDPVGNALALLVLLGMVASVVYGGILMVSRPAKSMVNATRVLKVGIPVLCAVGLGVAGYMAHVETAHVAAACGPVGDCNAVHQSEYARLLGWLPIGILGLAGYAAILFVWLGTHYGRGGVAQLAHQALVAITLFGLLFSIYLTFLEPFVIGATCAWCLASAVLMTALFWLAISSHRDYLTR
jgi:uncharacterized membrane protein/thiol-disulfide isomerase/thioredoxin